MSCLIDDVQYLQSVGNQESYLFMVDSAQRTKSAFPHPNYYEASFNEPFYNCYSISLIGAKIPRTQYIVDTNNNVLTYRIGASSVWETLTVKPGDYTALDLVAVLNAALPEITVSVIAFQNRLMFTSKGRFAFDMTLSSMRRVLGFSEPVDVSNMGYGHLSTYQAGPETNPLSHDVFTSVAATGDVTDLMTGPDPQELQGYNASTTRLLFIAAASGVLTTIKLLVTSTASESLPVELKLQPSLETVATGWISISTSTSPTYVSAMVSCNLVGGNTYILGFPTTTSSVTLYADEFLAPNITRGQPGFSDYSTQLQTATVAGSISWAPVDNPALCLIFELEYMGESTSHQLIAPGVYDFTGIRYVSIQCKELTDHLFRSRAYDKWCAGLGIVDLGVYGFQNQSFDFSSYPPRTFHPFTLRKLTLSFLCEGTNVLYDFKGIDHQLTFVIRYYTAPAVKEQLQMLNRLYEPNPNKVWLAEYEKEQDLLEQHLRERRY